MTNAPHSAAAPSQVRHTRRAGQQRHCEEEGPMGGGINDGGIHKRRITYVYKKQIQMAMPYQRKEVGHENSQRRLGPHFPYCRRCVGHHA